MRRKRWHDTPDPEANRSRRKRIGASVSSYHQLRCAAASLRTVDEATWDDLSMDEVFARLDYTVSPVGQQRLYHVMRTYASSQTALLERANQYAAFRADPAQLQRVRRALLPLKREASAEIARVVLGAIPEMPRWVTLIYLSSALSLVSMVMVAFSSEFIMLVLALGLINILIHGALGSQIASYAAGLSQVSTLLRVGQTLAEVADERLPQTKLLRLAAPELKALRKRMGWLIINKSGLSDLAALAVEYLNLFCLFEVVAYFRFIRQVREKRQRLEDVLLAVGELDLTTAVAIYLQEVPGSTPPRASDGTKLRLKGVYHPLIAEAVPNDLELNGQSCLITGSNMAGKTTFIKTVGVNLLLAQTLGFVLASEAELPGGEVLTSFRRDETLRDGRSYFQAEARRLLGFLTTSARERPIFLIDEIFRGTNTVERIAASRAVLERLADVGQVLVTTHDLELLELLPDYAVFHFSEQVEDDRFYFDYRLHNGPCRSRNAIRLLELTGYPLFVTQQARATAVALDFQRQSPKPGSE